MFTDSTNYPLGTFDYWSVPEPNLCRFDLPAPMWTITYPAAPTECSGDVHVFPCKKCGECKCGKAKLAKAGQK
jgi:hypothetical protein